PQKPHGNAVPRSGSHPHRCKWRGRVGKRVAKWGNVGYNSQHANRPESRGSSHSATPAESNRANPSARMRDPVAFRGHFEYSFDVELDSAGRVTLNAPLLEHAGISKDVVVIGAVDHLEVWDRARHAQDQTDLHAQVEQIAENLGHPS